MNTIISKALCIGVDNSLEDFFYCGRVFPIDVKEIVSNFEGKFCLSNSVIAFVKDSNFYVIPSFEGIIKSLQEVGFKEEKFYVPFSICSYPALKEDRAKWEYISKSFKISRINKKYYN